MAGQFQEQAGQHRGLEAASIPAFIAGAMVPYAATAAFTCLGHSLRYRDVAQMSDHVAAWLLVDAGLQPGDRVALQLPNVLQFPVVALGILKAGMVLVNVNPLYTPAELLHQLRDSEARLLFVLANMAHNAASILAGTSVQQVVVTELFDLHPAPQRVLMNAILRQLKPAIAATTFPGQLSLRRVLQRGSALLRRQQPPQQPQQRREDLALLQYTGGTTGTSRAAILSHGNLLSNVAQLDLRLADNYPPAGAVVVVPLPLYHIYAFTLGFLGSMAQGHHVLLIPDPRDLKAFMKALRPWRVSGFLGIDTLYRKLCEHPPFAALDFSSLRLCSAGGMALSSEVALRWKALTGCDILEGYGMSECSPVLACNTREDLQLGSVGRVVHGTQLQLQDAQGREVAPGMPGEICVRGPQVMQGYWRAPDDNAAAFDGAGWFHTGDVGVLDAEGRLSIVDRIKDIIIISGFNVYPNELEQHVCRHPQVSDACAVGVGDDFSMQIRIFVVRRDATLTAEEVIRWCRQGLAPYKVPRQVEFRPYLPKSNVGKVLRKELRATIGKEDHFTV
jgi:long-chain acyl-CoA synthetase